MTPDELLTTTRSVRRRLDFERSVPRELLLECIEIAAQAPSATNRQTWQWLIVTDAARKRSIADCYRKAFDWYTSVRTTPYYEESDPRRAQDPLRSCEEIATAPRRGPLSDCVCTELGLARAQRSNAGVDGAAEDRSARAPLQRSAPGGGT